MALSIPIRVVFIVLLAAGIFHASRNLLIYKILTIRDLAVNSQLASFNNEKNCRSILRESNKSNFLDNVSFENSTFCDNKIASLQCLINNASRQNSPDYLGLTPKERNKVICSGLGSLQKALKLNPQSPVYHLASTQIFRNLANIEFECKDGESIEDFSNYFDAVSEKGVLYALSLAPSDSVTLYLVSLVMLDLGHKNKALETLSLLERINPLMTLGQKKFFYSLITSESDLRMSISTQYPNVMDWIEEFYHGRQKDYFSWSVVFREAFLNAFRQFNKNYESGDIRKDYYSKELGQLLYNDALRTNDIIRRELDRTVSFFCKSRNDKTCFELLSKRASLDLIPVKKSVIKKDKVAGYTPLENWQLSNSEELVRFNVKDLSLGIHFEGLETSRHAPSFIILENDHIRSGSDNSLIMAWGSFNNTEYNTVDLKAERVVIFNRELLVLNLGNNFNYPFLKIQYKSSDESGTFRNKLSTLIQVY